MKENIVKKPIVLRVVFILNAILSILPFLFYFVLKSKGKDFGIPLQWMIYTGVGYILSFAIMVYSILNKKMLLFRLIFVVTLLMSIPTKAYIGIVVAIVSILLSFSTKIKHYFNG